MKILFVRHGESVDDVEDRYGGAADFDLTEKGREQVFEAAKKISLLNENFEMILSSPLKRAIQSAEIISRELGIELDVFEDLKERDLNGVLTGLVRSEAKKKHPEIVEKHNRWEYVEGSEREEDFRNRVRGVAKHLLEMEHDSLIIVTHGLFLKMFFKEMVGVNIDGVGDGAFILVEEKNGDFKILKGSGVKYEK